MKKFIRKVVIYIVLLFLVSTVSIATYRYYVPRVVQVANDTLTLRSEKEMRIEELQKTEEAQTVLRVWAEKKYIAEQRQKLAELEKQVNEKELSSL